MRSPHGQIIITGPDGTYERDTIRCCHCQRVVEVPPFQSGPPDGGWCGNCAAPVCGPCADLGICTPFERALEWAEARGRFLRSAGLLVLLLLGLLAGPVSAQDYPPELPPLVDPIRALQAFGLVSLDEPRDESEVMDILVVWSACGNFTPALAQQAVDAANADYARSGIRGRLRLVGAHQVSFVESMGSGLTWMARTPSTDRDGNPIPGGRPEIEAARTAVGADLVHMVTCDNACGIGYLNATATNAYSTSERSCTIGNRTFQHEVGHNQGAHHDPPSVCGQPTCNGDNYGHGWGPARSVMAYPAAGGERVGHFSNPDVLHSGLPTGILGQRNNARVINSRAAIVAGFRARVVATRKPSRPVSARVEAQ
jgi:hypothetical protein